jgi:hypothetical protein
VFMVNLVKFLKGNLNCIRLYLNKGKIGNSMVITHEQWVLTSFLSLGSLKLFFGKFLEFL